MDAQHLLVGLIVLGSLAYAGWTLMPAAWRRGLATRLLRWPALRSPAWLQRAARPASGCGCEGCDAGTPSPGTPQRIVIVRKPKAH